MAHTHKPGGLRANSARELEVRGAFEQCWQDAQVKTGAMKGQVLYGGRHLQNLITALRRAELGRETREATANDALFLVKSFGVPDGDLEHYAVDKEKMRTWWMHEVFGYQGHMLNTLLTRHVLGKPRPSFHQLPPGNVHFGKSTVNAEPNIIKELVEGNFAMMCERRPPAVWPPPRRIPGDDGKVHGAKSARPAGSRELFTILAYGYGRIMGEGKEHSYVETKKRPHGMPKPRHTRGSELMLALKAGTYVRPGSARPGSARTASEGGGGGATSARPMSARPMSARP